MAHAKITIPGGILVQLEGTAEEVTAVLDNLKAQHVISPPVSASLGRPRKIKGEIPGLVESLKCEEFFRMPRGLSDVQKKLSELGHHYPITTLSGAMQAQTRTRNLRRFKQGGKYVYTQ